MAELRHFQASITRPHGMSPEPDAGELGDPDAEITLGDAEDHELAWYAVQGLPFVLELMV